MSRVKNVSGGPLDVPLLDRVVEAGETVDVPDVQGDGESPIVWPGNRWEPVPDPVVPPEPKRSRAVTAVPPPPAPRPPAAPKPVSSDPRER